MAQSNVRLLLQRIQAWNQTHPREQIDPAAEVAVAGREGLSGGIGDGGHAFGPNQLNNAGGVLTGKFGGRSPEEIQRWAWSPQGIDYALAGVADAAGNEKGARAVRDIVQKFERPAAPGSEIAGALASYGRGASSESMVQPSGAGQASPVAAQLAGGTGPQAAPQTDYRPLLAQALTQGGGDDYQQFYATLGKALQQRNQPQPQFAPTPLPAVAGQNPPVQTLPDQGGLKLTAIPLNLASRAGIQVDQQILPTVAQLAQKFGVKVNSGYRSAERNAAVNGAANSDHLRGDAVDFVGTPQQMKALYQFAQNRFAYVEPWAQTGGNHVHISLRRGGR